jgi:hypothetical protein
LLGGLDWHGGCDGPIAKENNQGNQSTYKDGEAKTVQNLLLLPTESTA